MDTNHQAFRSLLMAGHQFIADCGEHVYKLNFISDNQLAIEVIKGKGIDLVVDFAHVVVRPNVYLLTWQEEDKTTVSQLADFEQEQVYAYITRPGQTFHKLKGSLKPVKPGSFRIHSLRAHQQENIAIVTEFLDRAFNKNDPEGATRLLSDTYKQHNPYMPDGAGGISYCLGKFYRHIPKLGWKIKHVFTDRDYVIVHSEYDRDVPYSTIDIFRLEAGKIEEHWEVSQKILPLKKAANKNTMF